MIRQCLVLCGTGLVSKVYLRLIGICIILLQHHSDNQIGVHVIDSWTYYALEFLNSINPKSQANMQQFVSPSNHLLATVAMIPYLLVGFI